jgi:hypothetical protein
MKNFLIFLCVFLGTFAAGCSWLGPQKAVSSPVTQSVHTVKVIDEQRLREGGQLLISAFQAGPGIEAGSNFDKISFSVSRGLADVLGGESARFVLLSAEESQEAELVMEGRIVATGRRSLINKMLFRKEKARLSVEGKMVDRPSGRVVLVFREERRAENKKLTSRDLGYLVGRSVAAGILGEIQ